MPLEQFFYNSEGAGTKREWGGRLSRVSPKRPSPILEYVLVHIETDEGVTGVGEAPADIGFFGQTVEGVQVAVEDYLGPQLVGKDPFEIELAVSHRRLCLLSRVWTDVRSLSRYPTES